MTRMKDLEVKSMKPFKKNISLYLDEDVIEQVKILAEKFDRSSSQVINIILKSYLEKRLIQSNRTTVF